jgi:hypothetical protein
MRARGWRTSSLWTRSSNEPARWLYEGLGYDLTADASRLDNGDQIVRYGFELDGGTQGDRRATTLPSRRTGPETADCPGEVERRISRSYRRSRASLVRESRLHTREVGGSKSSVPTHESPVNRLLSISSRASGRVRASGMSSEASLVGFTPELGCSGAASCTAAVSSYGPFCPLATAVLAI